MTVRRGNSRRVSAATEVIFGRRERALRAGPSAIVIRLENKIRLNPCGRNRCIGKSTVTASNGPSVFLVRWATFMARGR
jgi:hypothetical protein